MDNPAERGSQGTAILIGIAAVLGAMAVACAAWAAVGYYVATTLSLGLILLPLGSGCAGGLMLIFGRKSFRHKTGWVAVVSVLVGCIVGDLVWIMLATQKPVGLLLGSELVMTLNTLFNLQKAVMYFFACYLAYAISNPSRGFAPD